MIVANRFNSFKDYYAYFLSRHKHKINRVIHFISTLLFCLSLPTALLFHAFNVISFTIILAFGCCFLGHVLFEKNNPLVLRYFLWSLIAVFVFSYEVLNGKERLN